MRFTNEVVIVTGSAEGIGKAIAQRFVDEGACVVIADIDAQTGQHTASELGPSAIFIGVDVSAASSVDTMLKSIHERFGKIDILVNNAGISEIVPFLECSEELWDKHININLKGAYLCSQSVLKYMVPRRSGKLINISSQSGKKGNSQYEAYCASKFGIIGLTQSLAVEFATYGITVNAVCPGVVWTSLWEKMAPQYAAKYNIPETQVKDFLASKIPLLRLCKPEDVAAATAFLASPDADYMTGQALNVSGGAIMH